MKISSLIPVPAAAALLLLGALGTAQIERLDLGQMVQKTDDAVFGSITGSEVFRVDHPIDGPELYFTTLFIDGRSLVSGAEKSVAVTFMGGFIDDEHGVYNSEAPAADDIVTGNQVVAFYKWTENMGGDVSANGLYASHGGIYTTFDSRNGRIVQGRGDGYAIEKNVTLSQLDAQITELAKGQ